MSLDDVEVTGIGGKASCDVTGVTPVRGVNLDDEGVGDSPGFSFNHSSYKGVGKEFFADPFFKGLTKSLSGNQRVWLLSLSGMNQCCCSGS